MPQNTTTEQSEHIVILLMVGEGEKYHTLEQAIRRVFECPPYYFQVQLASDYTYKRDYLENIHEHIKRAHGVVVEISELNPSIMFELGLAIFSDQGRIIFPLRSQNATVKAIAGFSSYLPITYGSLNDSFQKLVTDIGKNFYRDGRIIHSGVYTLLYQRTKRFLSRTLLENLRRTSLKSGEIISLLKHYTTIEDLLATDPMQVTRTTGLPEYMIMALRGALEDEQVENISDIPVIPEPEVSEPLIEPPPTQISDIIPIPEVKIPLPEEKPMNPEIFLEQSDVTPLIKALIPVFTRINGGSDRHSLLENADIDSAFIGNLRLDAQPNIFTLALVAAFKSYKISNQKNNYHPVINLLESLVGLAEIYGLSDEGLKLCDRLINQGKENFKALIVRNAVGRIESPQGTGIGTGVLVAKNLLLTCNHIFTKTRVQTAWIRFGYKSDSYGTEDAFELNLLNFVDKHPQLDYALIRLQSTPSVPPIRPVNVILDSGQKIRLIHHPKGQPVVISGLGEIVQVGEDYIDHNLNTEEGSSGAPIFNDAWELVAIHRGNPGVARLTQGTMEGKPISAFWNQIASHVRL